MPTLELSLSLLTGRSISGRSALGALRRPSVKGLLSAHLSQVVFIFEIDSNTISPAVLFGGDRSFRTCVNGAEGYRRASEWMSYREFANMHQLFLHDPEMLEILSSLYWFSASVPLLLLYL